MKKQTGFTLVEVLVVIVIIAILAVIAIPRITDVREKAYGSTIRADLKNLMSAEEVYYSDNLDYTDDTGALSFTASENVTAEVSDATSTGYVAMTSHTNTEEVCIVYVGDAEAPETCSPTAPGRITCCIEEEE